MRIFQSDIDIYFVFKTFKNEPTKVQKMTKTAAFHVSHKSNKGEGDAVEEDNGTNMQGAEYQAVSATGGK